MWRLAGALPIISSCPHCPARPSVTSCHHCPARSSASPHCSCLHLTLRAGSSKQGKALRADRASNWVETRLSLVPFRPGREGGEGNQNLRYPQQSDSHWTPDRIGHPDPQSGSHWTPRLEGLPSGPGCPHILSVNLQVTLCSHSTCVPALVQPVEPFQERVLELEVEDRVVKAISSSTRPGLQGQRLIKLQDDLLGGLIGPQHPTWRASERRRAGEGG